MSEEDFANFDESFDEEKTKRLEKLQNLNEPQQQTLPSTLTQETPVQILEPRNINEKNQQLLKKLKKNNDKTKSTTKEENINFKSIGY